MSLFEEISGICNPHDAKQFTIKLRIEQLEADLQFHLTAMNDIEKDIKTLKSQLNDTPKANQNHFNTIVDSDDVPPYSFV